MSVDHASAGEPDVETPSMILVGFNEGGDPAKRPMFARSRNIFNKDEVANLDASGSVFRPFGELLQVESLERFPVLIK